MPEFDIPSRRRPISYMIFLNFWFKFRYKVLPNILFRHQSLFGVWAIFGINFRGVLPRTKLMLIN